MLLNMDRNTRGARQGTETTKKHTVNLTLENTERVHPIKVPYKMRREGSAKRKIENDSSVKQIAALAPHSMMQKSGPITNAVREGRPHYAAVHTDSPPKSRMALSSQPETVSAIVLQGTDTLH